MMKFWIFGIAGAAILALAMNGCGSSSDTSDTMEEMLAPTPTALETKRKWSFRLRRPRWRPQRQTRRPPMRMLLAAQEGR